MEKKQKRHLFGRIVRIIIVYLLLNAGIFGWIQVSAASGSKIQQTEAVMAQVRTEEEDTLEIAVLGKSVAFDFSFLREQASETLLYAWAEPVLLAAGTVLVEYTDA